MLLAGEEDLPRTGRLAAPSPSSALDKRRAPPAQIVREHWSLYSSRGRETSPAPGAWRHRLWVSLSQAVPNLAERSITSGLTWASGPL